MLAVGTTSVRTLESACDENGLVTEVRCSYDPETRSGNCERKVKGTLHWLYAADAVPAAFRHYETLLRDETPEDEGKDFTERLNPNSLATLDGFVEPAAANAQAGDRFQFIRMGYYCKDADSTAEKPVFNRVVGLKDSFKIGG